jgi:two-component system sensor histidine kinase GlrK
MLGCQVAHSSTPGSSRPPAAGVPRRQARLFDMKRYRPRSILRLIMLGFGLATLPLIAALITAAFYVDRVTVQGQRAVYDAAHNVRASQMLGEELTAMERNARQYHVLGDPSLYKVYLSRRKEFLGTVDELRALQLSADQRARLNRVAVTEQQIFDQVKTAKPGGPAVGAAMKQFDALAEDTRMIQRESSELVAKGVETLQQAAARAQRLMAWQTLALIPAAIGLSALFVYLIARPVRQIDQAIRRLGSGEFAAPVVVEGPQDLEELGRRLDWMRERLLELENQKVMFLRHMSHELKTPLATIREGAELLNERLVGSLNAEQAEVVDLLRGNSLQLQSLIENLLNFSIAQSTSPSISGRAVHLDQVIRNVLGEHRLSMRSKQLQPVEELDAVSVIGDPEKLRTVVDNLISNAVKFSPTRGKLRVLLQRDADHAIIEVQDEGPGITREDRDRVFEAFFQGQAKPQGHVKGTGLGLSIAREYVRSHGGEIRVAPTHSGAMLRVSLPLRSPGTAA